MGRKKEKKMLSEEKNFSEDIFAEKKRNLKPVSEKVSLSEDLSEESQQSVKELNQSPSAETLTDSSEFSSESLKARIEEIVSGLIYISETDADVEYFSAGTANEVTKEILVLKVSGAADKKISETNFEDFFEPLTKIEDWFGEEEKAYAEKFSALREILKANLKQLKVFKIGKIHLDIYIIGLDKGSILTGVKTKAVET